MKQGLIFLAASALAFAAAVAQAALGSAEVSDAAVLGDRLPQTLGEFGFFADAPRQVPAPGVAPYRLNVPLYSDGAEKLRFAYVPKGKRAVADGEGLLQFPIGSALIKTFAFGEGSGRRLIETRVLLHRSDGWVALPYRWNAEQTEARLALAGARLPVATPSGEELNYRIPNKNQCKECHGLNGEVTPIGPKARNLSGAWLEQMVVSGHLDAKPSGADAFPLWEARDQAEPAKAARAYLDVNCAHCHQPGATASNSGLDLRWEQTDPHSIGIFKRPVAAGRGAGGHEFSIVPGQPDDSILLYRMQSIEPGVAMPELGKGTVDADGVAAVRKWVAGMEGKR
ncbi:SO2930 family diheme c-type cytochrome [Altererythrobacter litoralis]|uniref:SO2930 family diheme c-type cytochrome n=1 Tax=Altererythrobacter litoralis TaxID=3113904 RepID=A0ABU7GH82_9SPHN|nr:SO2930 family diheme c-type cytochrome [Erythrobacteraceae bacterium 1XM1-14]